MKAPAILAALIVIGSTALASAHDTATDYRKAQIDARQAAEAHRIQQGRRTGDLTLVEAWRLKAEQARIARLERNALRDGHISRHEQIEINQALNRANRHIARERHDGQMAWWRR